jgi:hypothetical protein
MTLVGDRILAGLGATFRKRAGDLLPPIVEALAAPLADVDDLLEPTAGGWARVFDLDTTTAPSTLGAATGTLIPSGLTLEDQRAYLRDQPSRRRGSADAIIAAARAAAPGRQVDLFERLGSPWHLQVRLTGGADDPAVIAAVTAAVELQKPVGITLDVVVEAGASFAHFTAHHGPTLGQLATQFATLGDIATHIPEGGTTP